MSMLRSLLDEKNITISDLHSKTGISRTTLSNLVNAHKIPKTTKIETLERIATAINIPISRFFEDYQPQISVLRNDIYQNGNSAIKNPLYDDFHELDTNLSKNIYGYLGILSLKVGSYKKPLLIGYSGSTIGTISFEIFGEYDLNNLWLANIGRPNKQIKFDEKNTINTDVNFINSLTPTLQKRILDKILESNILKTTIEEIFSYDFKIVRTQAKLTSRIEITNFPNGNEDSNKTAVKYNLNNGGRIARQIVKYLISTFEPGDETDALKQILKKM
ncbi:XRE family transcriptional regulator [Levilactobacillus brevis]|uniref:helix-turn-helix domain-containing protein n=1 Tax=Levilactobacillus brevis TaxID=1580 RepID=UPI00042793B8|nr:helix-turn-helix transcriptional regulator [Levilactobacillus brevis]ATU69711.1 XRE family transcriptional regulator [Levilactobacillus brevis]MDA0409613.1 helix-turn-helix transcriptional regulator [Levilactobacillus brevis]